MIRSAWAWGLAVCGVAAACGGGHDAGVDAGDGRIVVATLHVTMNPNVDILFALDDSPGGLEQQLALADTFASFVNVLNGTLGGLPSIHIGVVSSDLGTKGRDDPAPGPSLGSVGMGGCSGEGKAGNLQTNGTSLVSGAYISDIRNSDGSRSVNYTGKLEDAFRAIATLGAGGCGFEQPLESMKRALDNNPANAGFLRPDANLAVIMVADEDDCSMAHSSLLAPDDASLGPLQSFRCTRFGVTCDVGGKTPDEMNMPGAKSACHSNAASQYLTSVASYADFLHGLKADPAMIYFGAIVGPAEPVAVELRTPPGGGAAIPALAEVCPPDPKNADPAVRIAELEGKLEHHSLASVCTGDDTGALVEAAQRIRSLIDDSCLSSTLSRPLDCVVTEVSGGVSANVPACGAGVMPCWQVVVDMMNCGGASHERFDIQRSMAPAPDTVDTFRCRP